MSDQRTTRILQRLLEVAADLSGYSSAELDVEAEFMELGFDSLFLTQLSQAFSEEFGVEITFRHLLDSLPTLRAVAEHVEHESPPEAPEPVEAVVAPQISTAPVTPGPIAVAPPATARPDGAMGEILMEQLRLMNGQLAFLLGSRASPGATASSGEVPDTERAGAPPAVAAGVPITATAAESEPSAMAATIALSSGPPRGAAKRDGARLTPHQEKSLADLVRRYVERTAESRRLTQAWRKAHADPRTAAGFNPLWKDAVYPIVVNRSLGSRMWDVDGNEYIDLLNGFGPNLFGHSAPFVVEAIRAQLERGFEVGPQTPLAGETAALLCELTGMDRATFVCTGSEAVQAAIRAARTHTGRQRIVLFEGAYHGNFDPVLVRGANRPGRLRAVPGAPGIPPHAVEDVIVLPYGEPEALEIIRAEGDRLAAVLVEPVQSRRPELQPRDFLHELRDVTREHGTLLVFDEVVTGFRCHPGGAQAHFGVEADLATYGKVIGGGLPIGVVAGRDPYMDVFDGGMWAYGDDSFPAAGVTFFAGTFVRHPLAIAAAHACLSHLKEAGPDFQLRLNQATTHLVERLSGLFEETGAPLRVAHFASIMYVSGDGATGLGSLLFHLLKLHGVMAAGGYPAYLTAAHSEDDVDQVVAAFRASVQELQEGGLLAASAPRERTGPRAPVAVPEPVRPAPVPPLEGARLGRCPDGSPSWFIPDPGEPGAYLQVTGKEVDA